MSTEIFETIVVGAGIIGSCTAYYLSKALGPGKVLLLEQFDYIHKKGSSHGESRIIRKTYPEYFNASLMSDCYKFWGEIEVEAGTQLFTKTGGLTIGTADDQEIQNTIKCLDSLDISYTILDSESIGQKFPVIRLPEGYIAIYQEDAGVLNATKCVATVQFLARRHGCKIYDNTEVIDIQSNAASNGDITVTTRDGHQFFGKKCVVTVGPWTSKLLDKYELGLQLNPVQLTVAYWQVETPELFSCQKFPVFVINDDVRKLSVYGSPAIEYPNQIKCCPEGDIPCDPDHRDYKPVGENRMQQTSELIATFFCGVSQNPVRTESCIITHSLDSQFVIDNIPSHPNIFIGCGFSGHGFKHATVVGHILSNLATTGIHPYPHVISHYGLKRFQIEEKLKAVIIEQGQ